MKRHFAFVAPPAHGHINPTLPLVEELARRGHRVSYATGEEFVPAVEESGAHGIGLPDSLDPAVLPQGNFTLEAVAAMFSHVLASARRSFPVLAWKGT